MWNEKSDCMVFLVLRCWCCCLVLMRISLHLSVTYTHTHTHAIWGVHIFSDPFYFLLLTALNHSINFIFIFGHYNTYMCIWPFKIECHLFSSFFFFVDRSYKMTCVKLNNTKQWMIELISWITQMKSFEIHLTATTNQQVK